MRPGEQIGGFLLERELGRGAMAIVFAGRRVADGKVAAVKLIVAALDPEQARRFEREQGALAALEHPNVIRVLAAGIHAGRPFVAMELAEGGSLEQLMRREGRLPWRRAAELGAQLARGLAAVHGAGIVHRDLKPANVLLDRDGRVMLADFGLVRRIESGSQLTATGSIVGTPAYIAPEQVNGVRVDGRADLYALGCLLHSLVAGAPPFAGSALGLLQQHLTIPPPPLSRCGVEVSPAFAALVLRLLEKAPDARPAGATAVADELARLASETAPSTQRAPRRLWPAVAVALASLGVAAAAGVVATRRGAPRPPAPPDPAQPVRDPPVRVAPPGPPAEPPRDGSALRSWRVLACTGEKPVTALMVLPGPPTRVVAAQRSADQVHRFEVDGDCFVYDVSAPGGMLARTKEGILVATPGGLAPLRGDGETGTIIPFPGRLEELLQRVANLLEGRTAGSPSFRLPGSSPVGTDLEVVEYRDGAAAGERLLFASWIATDPGGGTHSTFQLHDARSGRPTCPPSLTTQPGGEEEWRLTAIATCDGMVVCGYEERHLVGWHLPRDGAGSNRFDWLTGSPVTSLAGEGRESLFGTRDGRVSVLDTGAGGESPLLTLDALDHPSALTRTGQWIAVGTDRGLVLVAGPPSQSARELRRATSSAQAREADMIEVEAVELAERLPARPDRVAIGSQASTPDGGRAVVRLNVRQLEAWDLAQARPRRLACVTGFDSDLVAVAISPDGLRMASATAANEVHLFEVESAACLGWARVGGPVRRLWFADGLLQVGLETGTIGLSPP